MKAGTIRILFGIILIILQAMSIIGNAKVGIGIQLSFDSASAFLYDFVSLLAYLFVGIIGLIFLIWGIIAYKNR